MNLQLTPGFKEGGEELSRSRKLCGARDTNSRIRVDQTVVRGLEYYTGPVFEVELLLETKDEKGRPVRFGSVGGGGRYDGLVSRFRGEPVPATGFSIGVSRLQAALTMLGKLDTRPAFGPVVVTVFDRDRVADYQKMVAALRDAEHPRRALSRQPQEHGQPAQICRPAQQPLRHHPGKRREGDPAGRGADQGPDRGRQGGGCHQHPTRNGCRSPAERRFQVPRGRTGRRVREVLIARHDVRWGLAIH